MQHNFKPLFFYSLLLTLLIGVKTFSQSGLPAPFEINTDTITTTLLPDSNWQILYEKDTKLKLNDVLRPLYSSQFSRPYKVPKVLFYQNIWIRYKIKNNLDKPIDITIPQNVSRGDVYISDKEGKWKHYVNGHSVPWSKRDGLKKLMHITHTILPHSDITIYERNIFKGELIDIAVAIGLKENVVYKNYIENDGFSFIDVNILVFAGFLLFAFVFNLFFYYIIREKVYLVYSIFLLLTDLICFKEQIFHLFFRENPDAYTFSLNVFIGLSYNLFFITILLFLQVSKNYPRWKRMLLIGNTGVLIMLVVYLLTYSGVLPFHYSEKSNKIALVLIILLIIGIIVTIIIDLFKKRRFARLFALAICPSLILQLTGSLFGEILPAWFLNLFIISLYWAVIVISWSLFDRFKFVLHENARQALEKEQLIRAQQEERNKIMVKQKEDLEQQVTERTSQLTQSLHDLKQAQSQLIQSEKMASLGELTAGIAHEIQNPLNFVNNFSDVNAELIEELKSELLADNKEEAISIADDIKENEQKISHHGKRADAIVKGMLQHSRASTGEKEPTDINALADEYLCLAYQGQRAKDKSFNVKLITDFDPTIGKINIIPQDIGRVLLNLYNNAFYACTETYKNKDTERSRSATVWVSTQKKGNNVLISVKDNGPGIPPNIIDKIFQPFFTTKPTGQGTGLGLSLSYDIVKAHGGEIKVETKEADYAEFVIVLPINY